MAAAWAVVYLIATAMLANNLPPPLASDQQAARPIASKANYRIRLGIHQPKAANFIPDDSHLHDWFPLSFAFV